MVTVILALLELIKKIIIVKCVLLVIIRLSQALILVCVVKIMKRTLTISKAEQLANQSLILNSL